MDGTNYVGVTFANVNICLLLVQSRVIFDGTWA